MKESEFSAFTLERYRLGELSPRVKKEVEDALAADFNLRSCLEELDASDRDLRLRYPANLLGLENRKHRLRRRFDYTRVKAPLFAAAILLCILLPVFVISRNVLEPSPRIGNGVTIASASEFPQGGQTDRPKGQVPAGSELFLYLKGERDPIQSDYAALSEGNTVQLAYMAPAGSDHYGVIFSIDGRSVVTTHYPYLRGQSSLLVSGRRILLNEAYILDDAPDFEIFVFVVSTEPLNVEAVLTDARDIAETAETAEMIMEKTREVFETCEVETVIILKQ